MATPDRLPAVPGDAPPPALLRAARWATRTTWRTRAYHGPLTVPPLVYAATYGLYAVPGGQDLRMIALTGVGGAVAIGAHRIYRRRARRPLLYGEHLWQWAVLGCATVWETAASAINPADPGMKIFLGVLSVPLGIGWWSRSRLRARSTPADTADQIPQDAAPMDADQAPPATFADQLRALWADALAAPGGALAGSAVTDVDPNPHDQGGGYYFTVRVGADGGLVRLVPGQLINAAEVIHLALLRLIPDLHPANLVFQGQPNGTVRIGALEWDPRSRTATAAPGPRGGFTHPVARLVTNEHVEITLWRERFGGDHRTVVGSTGSGKSALMNLLIGLDGNTTTTDGRPLMCPVICDPHGGVSYGQWRGQVPIFKEPLEIYAALTAVCAELQKRLDLLAETGTDLIVPSPETPMIQVYIDEVRNVIRSTAALKRPALPLLERIGDEGRKCGIHLTIGTLAYSEEVFGSTILMDAIGGLLLILHSRAASTGLKINAGLWDAAADPRKVIKTFADGSAASGMGVWLQNGMPPQSVRYLWGAALSDTAAFAEDTARTITASAAYMLTLVDESGSARPQGEPAGAAQAPPRPAAAPGPGSAWEQARVVLDAAGTAMTLDQLHRATDVANKSTLAEALKRAADRGDVVRLDERAGWVLPAYADTARLDLTGVAA
jgi:hypothetical protein